MTQKEEHEHVLSLLHDNKNHTIVKHYSPSGKLVYRIRDAEVNPIANFSENLFQKFYNANILIQLNDREWQLK